MRRPFLAVGVFATLTVFSCGQDGTESAPVLTGEQKMLSIYQEQCRSCHGDDGRLGLSGAKDLTESRISKDSAAVVIANGRGAMRGFSDKLSNEDVSQLAEFIQRFKK